MGTYLTGEKVYDRTLGLTIFLTSLLLYNSRHQGRAPYGKFGGSEKNGINLDPRLGWWLMELPATLSFAYNFYQGRKARKAQEEKEGANAGEGPSAKTAMVLAMIWARHYGNRGWYFPLTLRVAKGTKQSFALFNAVIGMCFLSSHGYLNARMFSQYGKHLTDDWLTNPQFLLGMAIYEFGFWTTVHSEHVIKNLRPADGIIKNAAERYKIPYGGLFKYVTNPQYFGEITCFTGLLILSGSLSPLPAVLITLANLVPRSEQNHKWYLKKFGDAYPKDRKYLVPFLY